MEDKQNMKKVLESQGDVHEKVANQSNSELLSSSPTRSLGPSHIQIDVQISRIIFGATPPFCPDGPCIQLESIRDAS
jgi:hypothetical protein